MEEIQIHNKELYSNLEDFYRLFKSVALDSPKNFNHLQENILSNQKFFKDDKERKYYISDEYLHYLKDNVGKLHSGYPEFSYMGDVFGIAQSFGDNKLEDNIFKLKKYLATYLSCRINALFVYYPPDGMISWHTNWNVPGQNVILTRSESSDSYFKYFDRKSQKIVTLYDKVGWNCRMGMYGAKDSEEILYHCAEAKSHRITIGFSFLKKERNDDLHQQVKNFISKKD